MKIEELLQPRFKVIADYPNSDWKVGDILCRINRATENWYHTNYGAFVGGIHYNTLIKYPHLFRTLKWHENREVNELPKFLKFINDEGEIEFVLKVEKYIPHKDSNTNWFAFEYLWKNEPDLKRMSLQGWTPATEEEYLKQN